jgi:Protein of unknown function (DUF2867)
MPDAPIETTAPVPSEVAMRLTGAHFHDAWAIEAAEPELDALGQYLRVARQTPWWIERLMMVRNKMVSHLGLKDLGMLSNIDPEKRTSEYLAGDRVGIFTLDFNSAQEVLLCDRDRHLDVLVSVYLRRGYPEGPLLVTVTTVVHSHNCLGVLYMIPVRPMHRAIVRSMMRAVGRAL